MFSGKSQNEKTEQEQTATWTDGRFHVDMNINVWCVLGERRMEVCVVNAEGGWGWGAHVLVCEVEGTHSGLGSRGGGV